MACKESICRNCFHSYVCERFNENKDDNNEKCHFANDHYIPRADVAPKSELRKLQGENRIANMEIKNLEHDVEVYREEFKNIRAEVAREIFAEIEKCRVIGMYGVAGYLVHDVAELKKKYTEGKT